MKQNCIGIGLIGLGPRGLATIKRYEFIPEARIVAVSDLKDERVAEAQLLLESLGKDDAQCQTSDEIFGNPAVDVVMVCTDWSSHARLAIEAMRRGKDVAVEVPLASTISDCQQIVAASRLFGRRCFMLENCCYDVFHLGASEMVRRGLIGNLTHLECAYIHWLDENAAVGFAGNPYPTHAIGPMLQLLKSVAGDEMDSLVSIDTANTNNSINNTLIATRQGRTILLQFDETTPRPYNRLQSICGTKGFVQKYPLPTVQIGSECMTGDEAERFVLSFMPAEFQSLIDEGEKLGVPNLMNFLMDKRFVRALQTGTGFDIPLEDAALWSSLCEFTARSASRGGERVRIEHNPAS